MSEEKINLKYLEIDIEYFAMNVSWNKLNLI